MDLHCRAECVQLQELCEQIKALRIKSQVGDFMSFKLACGVANQNRWTCPRMGQLEPLPIRDGQIPMRSDVHASPYRFDPALVHASTILSSGDCASCMIASAYNNTKACCPILPRFAVVHFSFATEFRNHGV
jgi:hypothetical protein